ncbi:spermidine synthase [Herbihabitans rhizosphaerae]|uniref:Polyamine aminopropyltransferase n=1 Tax=Herbihabitans rhizosphaerae TaxID=1872711 RepID=A0A4Q7L4U2_9PSEU|nr:spermidine synthase [Herbihabitans rhizosphaerae]RZS43800.1 spermidine synthase [Herbihabitans rhizosphaerae]
MTRVVAEPLGDGLERVWRVDEVLFEAETAFQRLLIARTTHGVTLFCDDERQSAELSQLVYHEALMVPAFLLAERLERVLVIGSSEGVASQLAVAAGASTVDHVDIDRECVEACARHLPYGYTPSELAAAVAGDGAVRVHYADGYAWVRDLAATTDGARYDVVVVDLPDEQADTDAQHNRLYGAEFLALCKEITTSGGVVAAQAGCPTLWRNDTLKLAWRRFHEVFGTTVYFGSDEHEWAFLYGRADEVDPPLVKRLDALPYRPESIDAATLAGRLVPPHTLVSGTVLGR